MDYVSLQVPEHLYLQFLAIVASAGVEHNESAALVAENEQLRAQVYDQHEEINRLGALLEQHAARIAELRGQLDAAQARLGELDGDDSYPDHGREDDAAAGMGLPSETAGTAL